MSKPFRARNHYGIPPSNVPRIFKAGARHYLHPKLAILDQIDCVLEYYPDMKTMVVSYEPLMVKKDYTDYEELIYTKSIMSSTVDFIVEIISRDCLRPKNKEIQNSLNGDNE